MIQAFIISWAGKHKSAEKIYLEVNEYCEETTIVYSDPDDAFQFTSNIRSIRRPNEFMFGDKFETSIRAFSGHVFLLIHADCSCDGWNTLVERCKYIFENNPDVAVLSPVVTNSYPSLEQAEIVRIANSTLSTVSYTDSIVLALSAHSVDRLRRCNFKQNLHGWWSHIPAVVDSYLHNRLVVMDRSIKVHHAAGCGYSAQRADREGREFLECMSLKERSVWKILEPYNHIITREGVVKKWARDRFGGTMLWEVLKRIKNRTFLTRLAFWTQKRLWRNRLDVARKAVLCWHESEYSHSAGPPAMFWRGALRRAGLGRALYLVWHSPLAFIDNMIEFGALNLALARIGRAEMERAASRLAPLDPPPPDAPEIFFLTGRRFVFQTVFCAVSLSRRAGQSFRVNIVDDGTLRDRDIALLQYTIPGAQITTCGQIESVLDIYLPRERYPELRRRREIYAHLRKITDVHAMGGGWKLVLDSDMLFNARPEFLLRWLERPEAACHMIDVGNAYGYSDELLRELAGATLPTQVNVGICGLKSDAIDWDRLEFWCKSLSSREGSHYLLEQALVAMMLVDQPHMAAPSNDYVVAPSRMQSQAGGGVLHHYTAHSKIWYFRFAWREFIRNQNRSTAAATQASQLVR